MSLFQEPEMLQLDVCCEHTMQHNATAEAPDPAGGA